MIEGARPEKGISERTTKEYYVIMEDARPVGVCTKKDAAACLRAYAQKKNAIRVGVFHLYFYRDSSGEHLIYFRETPRMKMER